MNLFKVKNWKKSKKIFKPLLAVGIIIETIAIFYFILPVFFNTPVVFARIKSNSMQPILKAGDLVFISGRNKGDLGGQVIAFYDPSKGKIIVHRAVEKMGNCYITQGDNNSSSDFFQPCEDHILGKVLFLNDK